MDHYNIGKIILQFVKIAKSRYPKLKVRDARIKLFNQQENITRLLEGLTSAYYIENGAIVFVYKDIEFNIGYNEFELTRGKYILGTTLAKLHDCDGCHMVSFEGANPDWTHLHYRSCSDACWGTFKHPNQYFLEADLLGLIQMLHYFLSSASPGNYLNADRDKLSKLIVKGKTKNGK